MSLMGIDIGTSGCKVVVFSETADILSQAYREYDVVSPRPGWSELDSRVVWERVKEAVREAVSLARRDHPGDPVSAFSVSSFGEGVTPVGRDGDILDNCILSFDPRGEEYLEPFSARLAPDELFTTNGNSIGPMYTMPKLQWLRDNRPEVFDKAAFFLLWQDLLFHFMGCRTATDYSLAGRTLLFDIRAGKWSDRLAEAAGLPLEKMAPVVPAGTDLGPISPRIAAELGLDPGVRGVTGGHDQCCGALGAGVASSGTAVFGLGTYVCITPAFSDFPSPEGFMANNFGLESHVVPGLYVTFLYNASGGSVLKWLRDTLLPEVRDEAARRGRDFYGRLLDDAAGPPSRLFFLPHMAVTGPPLLTGRSSGVLAGLTLETGRDELVRGLLEGVVYYLRDAVARLEATGIRIDEYRPTGGGAKSPVWLQMAADIMGRPLVLPRVAEAGALGAAVLAGAGTGVFGSAVEAAAELVHLEKTFEPDAARHEAYSERFTLYQELYPVLGGWLGRLHDME